MREIKFRAKELHGDWVYGDLHTLCDAPHIHTEVTSYPFAGKRAFIDIETIGQMTGMHDKNGKDIYEGDIVIQREHPYELDFVGVVIYNQEIGCFRLEKSDKFGTKRVGFIASDIVQDGNARVPCTYEYEVIGNKWDNKELLK